MKHQTNLSSKTMILMLFIMFVDFIGLFMVVPVFTPILMKTSLFFPANVSHFTRTISIGLLIACYGLGQFLGSSFLGELSDQFGRKRIMMLAITLFALSNFICVFAVITRNLLLLFIGRIITGISSGNSAVIFAAVISGTPEEKKRGVRTGFVAGAGATGVIVGVLFGPYFSSSQVCHWFVLYTPFMLIGIVSLFDVLLVYFLYHDNGQYERRKLHPLIGFQNIYEGIKMPGLNILIISYFFFVCNTEGTMAAVPIFAVQKFHSSSFFIGKIFAVGGIVSVFSSFVLNRYLGKFFQSGYIYGLGLIGIAIASYSFLIPDNPNWFYLSFALFGAASILAWNRGFDIASTLASSKTQGKVAGIMQSTLAFAIFCGPFTVGVVASSHHTAPLIFAGSAAVMSLIGIILMSYRKRSRI